MQNDPQAMLGLIPGKVPEGRVNARMPDPELEHSRLRATGKLLTGEPYYATERVRGWLAAIVLPLIERFSRRKAETRESVITLREAVLR